MTSFQKIDDFRIYTKEHDLSKSGVILISGTFNPMHRGHVDLVHDTLDRVQAGDLPTDLYPKGFPKEAPLVVIPNSLNPQKKPSPIELRIQWALITLKHFVPELADRVAVNADPLVWQKRLHSEDSPLHGLNILQARGFNHRTIHQAFSPAQQFLMGTILPILIKLDISSSKIQQAITENRVDAIRAFIAPDVLEEWLRQNKK